MLGCSLHAPCRLLTASLTQGSSRLSQHVLSISLQHNQFVLRGLFGATALWPGDNPFSPPAPKLLRSCSYRRYDGKVLDAQMSLGSEDSSLDSRPTRPRRAASLAAQARIDGWVESGLEVTEATAEQLADGVCAICLDPLFSLVKNSRSRPGKGRKKGICKQTTCYRRTVCKRVVELTSCRHTFHNTCLMKAARRPAEGSANSRWLCPLCRKEQISLDDLQEKDCWRIVSPPET